MSSIIAAVQTFVKTYTGLASGAMVTVDSLGANIGDYAIESQPGSKVLDWYVNGGSRREFPFSLNCTVSNADDVARTAANEFAESISAWMETQTAAGTLPLLSTGKTPELIEATNWGYVFQEGESNTAIYQIQCRLVYEQQP